MEKKNIVIISLIIVIVCVIIGSGFVFYTISNDKPNSNLNGGNSSENQIPGNNNDKKNNIYGYLNVSKYIDSITISQEEQILILNKNSNNITLTESNTLKFFYNNKEITLSNDRTKIMFDGNVIYTAENGWQIEFRYTPEYGKIAFLAGERVFSQGYSQARYYTLDLNTKKTKEVNEEDIYSIKKYFSSNSLDDVYAFIVLRNDDTVIALNKNSNNITLTESNTLKFFYNNKEITLSNDRTKIMFDGNVIYTAENGWQIELRYTPEYGKIAFLASERVFSQGYSQTKFYILDLYTKDVFETDYKNIYFINKYFALTR